jgi:hypothetical protein
MVKHHHLRTTTNNMLPKAMVTRTILRQMGTMEVKRDTGLGILKVDKVICPNKGVRDTV